MPAMLVAIPKNIKVMKNRLPEGWLRVPLSRDMFSHNEATPTLPSPQFILHETHVNILRITLVSITDNTFAYYKISADKSANLHIYYS